MAQGTAGLRVSVLGPLVLEVDAEPVDVPGRQRRALLALLAMASPEAVTTDRIVDALWPGNPPATGAGALHSHVSRLRRHLGSHSGRLARSPGGYRLALEQGDLDAARFEALLGEARHVAEHDHREAGSVLTRALAEWRGPALGDLRDVHLLAAWATRLDEGRAEASELAVDCALEAGQISQAVDTAIAAVAIEPLRESTVALLARALNRQGRSAEALRAIHDHRTQLAELTGLDPSPNLGALERAIATGSEATAPETPRRAVVSAPGERLLGRDAALAGVERLLGTERMVTITGPGGVGKTLLARTVAHRASASGGAVTFVELASLTDDRAVDDVLSGALGLVGDSGNARERCIRRLESAAHLLVIDNAEHLIDAVRDLVTAMIDRCESLTVLVTSRERLAIPVERPCPLAPLPVPVEDVETPGARPAPSVALFIDRAHRVDPHRALDVAIVGDIVRAVDGIPLAIELTAGRLGSMSLSDLAQRLDRALDLFARPSPAGRHGTLRAAIRWSYDLLSPSEQALLRQLSVFPGGVDLASAEALARELGTGGDPAHPISHLVDSSIMSIDAAARYRMLDTVRQFALDELAAAGEEPAAVERLVTWAVSLVDWVREHAASDNEADAIARLRAEMPNLRAAWQALRAAGDVDRAATVVADLYDAVALYGMTEYWRWALELADDRRLVGRAREATVLGVAAEAAWFSSGDLDRAEALGRRGLAAATAADPRGRVLSASAVGDVLMFRGRHDEAHGLLLELVRSPRRVGEGLVQAGLAAAYGGNLATARALLDEAATVAICPSERGFAAYGRGEVATLEGDWAEAERAYRDAIDLAATTGADFLTGVASVGLLTILVRSDRVAEALEGFVRLIARWERTGAWTQQWTTLRNLADLLDALDEPMTADLLRASADAAPEAAAVGDHDRTEPAEPLGPTEAVALARATIARLRDTQ